MENTLLYFSSKFCLMQHLELYSLELWFILSMRASSVLFWQSFTFILWPLCSFLPTYSSLALKRWKRQSHFAIYSVINTTNRIQIENKLFGHFSCLSGILFNSMLNVISYNNFDLYLMFGIATRKEKETRVHVSTLKKQLTYNMIILLGNIG